MQEEYEKMAYIVCVCGFFFNLPYLTMTVEDLNLLLSGGGGGVGGGRSVSPLDLSLAYEEGGASSSPGPSYKISH